MGHALLEATFALVWLLGTCSGALWMAALERGDKNGRAYGRFMIFCYILCVLTLGFSTSLF
jgi:hypothetical protein